MRGGPGGGGRRQGRPGVLARRPSGQPAQARREAADDQARDRDRGGHRAPEHDLPAAGRRASDPGSPHVPGRPVRDGRQREDGHGKPVLVRQREP